MPRRWWKILGAAVGTALSLSCTEDVVQSYLRLSLNDSLSTYDSVEVALVSVTDRLQVYDVLFTGPLKNPKGLGPYSLDSLHLSESQFFVRVRAYKYGQLGLETRISRLNGTLQVFHDTGLSARPYSVALEYLHVTPAYPQVPPVFDTAITDYSMSVPPNIDTVDISALAVDSLRAAVLLNGTDTLPRGAHVRKWVDTMGVTSISLVVANHGYQRQYNVNVSRSPKLGPHLRAFQTDLGTWVPAFNPDSLNSLATLNDKFDTLRITALTADSGATVDVNGQGLASGLPPPLSLHFGANFITIHLALNGAEQVYRYQALMVYPRLKTFVTNIDSAKLGFSPDVFNYVDTVTTIDTLKFIQVASDSGTFLKLKINSGAEAPLDAGTIPAPIALPSGNTTLQIRATRPLATDRIYKFAVHHP